MLLTLRDIAESIRVPLIAALVIPSLYMVPIIFDRWRLREIDRALFLIGIILVLVAVAAERGYFGVMGYLYPDRVYHVGESAFPVGCNFVALCGGIVLTRQATTAFAGERCWIVWACVFVALFGLLMYF